MFIVRKLYVCLHFIYGTDDTLLGLWCAEYYMTVLAARI
jgi:ATP sulfurylase